MNIFNYRYFSKVQLSGIQIGKFISKRSFLASDTTTQAGIAEVKKILEKKEDGLLVYIAHLGLLDIFGTAAVLEKFSDFRAVFPVAASWFYFPVLRPIFKQLMEQVPHQFIPVFRKEELGESSEDVHFLNFSGLKKDEMKQANRKYAQTVDQNLQAGGVVLLAPYGGRAPMQEHLRSGPVKLLQDGVPVIFTLTSWNWKKMKYEVFFSEVKRFEKTVSKDEAHKIIYNEYARMAHLSGITQKQMLESKSGSKISRGIWKIVAKVVKATVSSDLP